MLSMPELEEELKELVAETVKKKYPKMEVVKSAIVFNNTEETNGFLMCSHFEFSEKKNNQKTKREG